MNLNNAFIKITQQETVRRKRKGYTNISMHTVDTDVFVWQ